MPGGCRVIVMLPDPNPDITRTRDPAQPGQPVPDTSYSSTPSILLTTPDPTHSCLALRAWFPHFPRTASCFCGSISCASLCFRPPFHGSRTLFRLPMPSEKIGVFQGPQARSCFPRTTSKDEGSGCAITSPILHHSSPCRSALWYPSTVMSLNCPRSPARHHSVSEPLRPRSQLC